MRQIISDPEHSRHEPSLLELLLPAFVATVQESLRAQDTSELVGSHCYHVMGPIVKSAEGGVRDKRSARPPCPFSKAIDQSMHCNLSVISSPSLAPFEQKTAISLHPAEEQAVYFPNRPHPCYGQLGHVTSPGAEVVQVICASRGSD